MVNFGDLLTSREEAALKGKVAFFTGVPCQNGHIDKRYTNTGICYACKRAINKRCNAANPETLKAISARSYLSNREAQLARSCKWAKNNREASRIIKRRNKEKYRAQYNKAEVQRVRQKCKTDYSYHLNRRMSKAVWDFLKSNGRSKNLNSWVSFVDYDISELVKHIENQFTTDMTWDNYGPYWHIDHIVPRSFFVKHPFKDKDYLFKCCWSLHNLRPLKSKDNISKGSSLLEDATQELIKLFKLEITDESTY